MMRTGIFETWNYPFSWAGGENFLPPLFFNNQVRISLAKTRGKTFLFLGCHSFYPGNSKANQQDMNLSSARGHPSTTWPKSMKRKNRGTNSKYSFIEEAHRKLECQSHLHKWNPDKRTSHGYLVWKHVSSIESSSCFNQFFIVLGV